MSTATSASLDDLLAKAAFTSPGIGNNLTMRMAYRHQTVHLILGGTSAGGLPDHVATGVANVLKAAHSKRAAVDLSQCPMLPSVAIAFLVHYQKTAEENGAVKVLLYGVSQRIATLLGMIGLKDFFVIVPTEADMLAWYERNGA
jgi:anti-anti-sigma regulatory factor